MRYSSLTAKDMSVTSEQDSAREQVHQTRGALRDHTGQHRVEMFWDINEDCKKDRIFKLKIDDYSVLLDWEQVARLGRWIQDKNHGRNTENRLQQDSQRFTR